MGEVVKGFPWLQRIFLLLLAGFTLGWMAPVQATSADSLQVSLDVPYSLGVRRTTVAPGETIRAIFNMESTAAAEREIPVEIQLPAGIAPTGDNGRWQVIRQEEGWLLRRNVALAGSYGQWFDLLTFGVADDLSLGAHKITIRAGEQTQEKVLQAAPLVAGVSTRQPPVFERIVLPLDKDGRQDEKQSGNAIVLRDRSLDYYKNILRGKGAANLEIEAIHPVTHMGLDFSNPAGQQKLVLVEAELLDRNTRRHIPGLYTPGSNSDNDGAGAMADKQERLTAFVALNGESKQRIQLPIYADESLLAEGEYLLRVTVEDGAAQVWSNEIPVTMVKKNLRGMMTLGIALVLLLVFLVVGGKRLPAVLTAMKTRRLITVALFGTCAFAVVNVPSTLLNDFFHIFLGPFAFVLTGMFSGVMLYMLTGALITLIPLQGVASLMAAIRLLLGMVAFGHMSPIVFLSYGINAFLLEGTLALGGFTSRTLADGAPAGFSLRRLVILALACALADTAATYVTLQGMSVLYRLYYADWYIYLVMAVNGFLYTMIGAGCGLLLGSRLADVGGD